MYIIKKDILLALFSFMSLYYLYQCYKKEYAMKKPVICSTTSIINDIVRNIVDVTKVTVLPLMGPGIDPHLYKPSSRDMYIINDADVLFYNGLHLEGKMADILESLTKSGKKVYAVSSCLDKNDLIQSEYDGIYDPHVWHDVTLWRNVVFYVSEILQNLFPELKNDIAERTASYIDKLIILEKEIIEYVGRIPLEKRVLVTSHDAFSYFGKRYNVNVCAIQGISTDAEATVESTEKVLRAVLDSGIRTIFVEHTICKTYMENIQSILQLKGKNVTIGEQLYSDALGEKKHNSYIAMMYANLLSIVNGLSKE